MQVIEFNWGLPYPGFDEVKELEKVRTIPNAMELTVSPNPFNGRVSVDLMSHFPVPRDSRVEIYSLDGRVVSTLHDGPVDPGMNSFFWEPGNMSSGIYLVVQTSGRIRNTERAIYLK